MQRFVVILALLLSFGSIAAAPISPRAADDVDAVSAAEATAHAEDPDAQEDCGDGDCGEDCSDDCSDCAFCGGAHMSWVQARPRLQGRAEATGDALMRFLFEYLDPAPSPVIDPPIS